MLPVERRKAVIRQVVKMVQEHEGDFVAATKKDLGKCAFETKVTEREQSGRTVFRVRAGPFDKKDDADKMKERLDATGLETALVRVQR